MKNKIFIRKPHTEETKRKISETRKIRIKDGKIIVSSETREKLRICNLGKIGYWKGKKRPEVKNFNGFITKGKIPWNKGKKLPEEMKNKLIESHKEHYPSAETKLKMKLAHSGIKNHYYGKKHSEEIRKKMRLTRAKQICPKQDTSIEVKIQDYLKQLGIEFYTHQYIKEIEHGYQCDILIPSKKCVIECFGTYWHNYPLSRQIDIQRCNELREAGYKVLIFWENEIKVMEVNDLKNKLIQVEIIK